MSDLIKRADAIDAMCGECLREHCETECLCGCSFKDALSALPSAEAVKVAYICDGRKCDKDCSECFRTIDIEHAKDFKLMGDTYYQQTSADAVSREVYDKRTQADERIIDSYRREFSEVVSAEAVQGDWVRKEKEINDCDGHRAYYWYECSVCGARPPKDQWKNEWHSNFCPSCGARMKGGEDE